MALALLMSLLAAHDARLAAAIDRYESARFAQARDRLIELIDAPRLSTEEQIAVRTYLAASYFALKDKGSARLQLKELARRHPGAKPSPATFAPEFIALANEVWAEAAKAAPAVLPPSKPVVEQTPPPNLVAPPPPPGPSRPSHALGFLPLGIGHLVRGETAKGIAFLLGEVVAFGTCIGTLAWLESLKVSGSFLQGGAVLEQNRGTADALNVTYSAAFFTGVGLLVTNAIITLVTWPGGSES